MGDIEFQVVEYGSDIYHESIALRTKILRTPLGLSFSQEELSMGKEYLHIVGLLGGEVVSSLALVFQEGTCQMRYVAVRNDCQGKNIGSQMIEFCENQAQKYGFPSVHCNARETAVCFYQRNGYTEEGEYFEILNIPHIKMRKTF